MTCILHNFHMQLLPLVVQCLHYEGDGLWISTLSTLSHMITETPDLIIQYLDDLLTHLLKLTSYKPKMVSELIIIFFLNN